MSVKPSPWFVSRAASNSLALILAGGCGSRLASLTAQRPKPIVSVAGDYRSIDFSLSNCLNSGIHRIGVLTQYKAGSLEEYLRLWRRSMRSRRGDFVESWPSGECCSSQIYEGTADAVRKNCERIRRIAPAYVVVLAADHVYKMDYRELLATHIEKDADMTIGTVEVSGARAHGLGILTLDDNAQVIRFDEKPTTPAPLPGKPNRFCASMGIYVFTAEKLLEVLESRSSDWALAHDFGADIIPMLTKEHRVYAHRFEDHAGNPGYWRDIGTIDTLWQTNMDLIDATSPLSMADAQWPIRTQAREVRSAASSRRQNECDASVRASRLSSGVVVSGAMVQRSVLSYGVQVGEGSVVCESVVLPHARIGKRCRIRHAIVDEQCVVPDGFEVGYDLTLDARRFDVSEQGIAVVTRAAVRRDATKRVRPTECERAPASQAMELQGQSA